MMAKIRTVISNGQTNLITLWTNKPIILEPMAAIRIIWDCQGWLIGSMDNLVGYYKLSRKKPKEQCKVARDLKEQPKSNHNAEIL